jgi:hypothetical protein
MIANYLFLEQLSRLSEIGDPLSRRTSPLNLSFFMLLVNKSPDETAGDAATASMIIRMDIIVAITLIADYNKYFNTPQLF